MGPRGSKLPQVKRHNALTHKRLVDVLYGSFCMNVIPTRKTASFCGYITVAVSASCKISHQVGKQQFMDTLIAKCLPPAACLKDLKIIKNTGHQVLQQS